MWGSNHTSNKGKTIENVINCTGSCILNTGSNTHLNFSSGTFSSIDLSFSDPKSAPLLTWKVSDDLYDSNHYPIFISSNIPNTEQTLPRSYWRLKNADWTSYTSQTDIAFPSLILSDNIDNNISLITDIILSAANLHIGKSTMSQKQKRVPWWNTSYQSSVEQNKVALKNYRKNKNSENLTTLRTAKAKSRFIIKQSKKSSWRNYVSSINENTNPTELWKEKWANLKASIQTLKSLVLSQIILLSVIIKKLAKP
uniref:Uncharacterized protein LOC114331866 n=1 Tax=Diabrotica virgifera virgifera TaxID=50390 RepID=A0A6P7FRD5_DIAVI